MPTETVKPKDIEKRSFEIISELLGDRVLKAGTEDIVKRVIHTTADFDYADNLVFSDTAAEDALAAIKNGVTIVTDTNMAFSGINKNALSALGGTVKCFMSDADVAEQAKKRGITRAMVSMEKICTLNTDNIIVAVGNAPTALIRLDALIKAGRLKPRLIIGVPVGFVNVVEAKELIISGSTPYIVARGNKGGSNVAAAIVNALLYRLVKR